MKKRRVIRKDEYVGVRMPSADKNLLEMGALLESRDTSDLAWVLVKEGLERLAQKHPAMKRISS